MAEKFEERYEDVLQNIEVIIVSIHNREPDLLDYDVDAVLEALGSRYGRRAGGSRASTCSRDSAGNSTMRCYPSSSGASAVSR